MLISTYQLAKSFAGKDLFHNLSLGIKEGDRIGLVGPNGAGKSTLMKILAGVMTPDKGDVTKQRGLRLGYLAQTPVFAKNETILQAVLSGCADPDMALGLAYEWLARLDLMQFGEETQISQLSGGWKKRVALARELVKEPDLLLLDEPTNHLDVTSILWLEDFLANARLALLMITHDRLFLQRVCNKIFDLDPQNPQPLLVIEGGYLNYLESKEQLMASQLLKEQKLSNTLRRETEWLRRGAQARQTKQKARIQNAHLLKDDVSDLAEKNRKRDIKLDFKETDRTPQKLIEVDGVSKAYGERVLFENLSLLINPRTRLALLGDNGCGKSTLIRCLLGQEKPDAGKVKLADGIKIAYFEQSRESLDPKKSVLKNICPDGDYVNFQGDYVFARSYLERFNFHKQQADLPVERLSGGEQARLRLAQMMLQEAQVLILDEPTNDLDVATLDVLQDALAQFRGAVILVTHDRYFMDQVADEILAFAPVEWQQPQLEKFTGYLQWEAWFEQAKTEREQAEVRAAQNLVAEAEGKKPVKLSYKETFELENMESNITTLEQKLNEMQLESAKPEVVSNSQKVTELYAEIGKIQEQLEKMYARWTELEKKSKGE